MKTTKKQPTSEETSSKVASHAAKILKDKKSSKAEKSVAGSALTQRSKGSARLQQWIECAQLLYDAQYDSGLAEKAEQTYFDLLDQMN